MLNKKRRKGFSKLSAVIGLSLIALPYDSFGASLEWDNQLLRFFMSATIIEAGEFSTTQTSTATPITQTQQVPEIASLSEVSAASSSSSGVPIQVQTNKLTSILTPSGSVIYAFSANGAISQITSTDFVEQSWQLDQFGALIITSTAYRPLDTKPIASQSDYPLKVRLFSQNGQLINTGTGILQVDLAKRALIYSSQHDLTASSRLSLSAAGSFTPKNVGGGATHISNGLSAQLDLKMQLTGSGVTNAATNAAAGLNALTAKDQIVGTLTTNAPNSHFGIAGFTSEK